MPVDILPTTDHAERAKAVDQALRIDGWLSRNEANKLFDLAKAASGPIVEIGSYQGRSTAALAFGSMAGAKQPVYAVDPFIGVPHGSRSTAQGRPPETVESTPQKMRANLDAVGVNGLVSILPVRSHVALRYVPSEIGVLFVDGDHDYEAVTHDLNLYLPRIKAGGYVMLHDVTEGDPGVAKAVDEKLMDDPEHWRVLCRVDSAIVAQRRTTTTKHKVLVGMPGHTLNWGCCRGLMTASLGAHKFTPVNSDCAWDAMNALWVRALNAARNGEITHFAMLHSDVTPVPGWLDTLLVEMDESGVDLVSTAIPIKDKRGLTSVGIGSHDDPWTAFRRFTMTEIHNLPETFGIEDTPHPDKFILHNTGCWVADLRRELFFTVDENRNLRITLNFPIGAKLGDDGQFVHQRESEDWYFSRQLALLGAKTKVTRKVQLTHEGGMEFSNFEPWGSWKVDEHTEPKWRPKEA